MSRVEHVKAMGGNPCPVCWKGHDGPEDHFCADCITPQPTPTATQPEVRVSADGKVYRPDGHGCCERVHPTELKAEDRGPEVEW